MLFLFSLCAPLLGTFLTPLAAFFVVALALLYKHGASIYVITFGLPTIIATLCWIVEWRITQCAQVAKFLLNVVLPFACMAAFYLHPVGEQAIVYSLYWLIPPLLTVLREVQESQPRTRSGGPACILNPALRITFITHAVGSVLWLYAIPTTVIFWIALIPIVAVERLCFAGITAAMVGAIRMVEHAIGRLHIDVH